MTERAERILNEGLALSAVERAKVADALLSSLNESDQRTDVLWVQEAESRLAAYDAGQMGSVPAEEVFPLIGDGHPTINRSVLILRPRPPFVDWAARVADEDPVSTAEFIERDLTAYLVPSMEEEGDEDRFLETHFQILFEEELVGWMAHEPAWPAQRDLATFHEWFDAEFHSVVIDVADDPLGYDC